MAYLTLAQQLLLLQNPLQRGVVQIFPETSPVLQYLPFMDVAGNAYQFNVEKTLPGIGFRDWNVPYDPSVGVVQRQTENLKVFGGLSQFDRALLASQGTLNDARAIHDSLKAKACAMLFTSAFFNGDSTADPQSFDGLANRLAGDQVIDLDGTSPLDLCHIDKLIDCVAGQPDVLFMNKETRRLVNTLRREAGQATEVVNDVFGRQINAFGGIPIAIIEEDPDGEAILTNDIYACRFGGGQYVSGLQCGPMQVFDQGLQGIFYTTLIEWIASFSLFHPRSASRLTGWIV